jgi:hypothetical protein
VVALSALRKGKEGAMKLLELKRVPVSLQRGRGLMIELTPGSTRKVWKVLARLKSTHADAKFMFDFDTQEAVFVREVT